MCKSLKSLSEIVTKFRILALNKIFFIFSPSLRLEEHVIMGNNQSTPQTLPQEDIDEINTLASKDSKEIKTHLQKKCDDWKNTKVTIGITGCSHRGKSTFINTVRNIKPGDRGAAAVKNKECTYKPGFYEFPSNENITLVDLPGAGTNNFQSKEYFEQNDFSRYANYFVLMHCV